MKKALSTLLMGLALVSCSTPEPRPTPMQLDFSGMGKLYLTTQDVNVVNRAYSTPQRPPFVGHLFEPRLADAIERWGQARLQSTGTAGHATLIIKEASVTQQSLPMEGGMDGWFTRQQATKYVGRVEVAFEAQNPQEHTTGLATASAVHAITIPEDPTETEKYTAYKSLVDALMKDLNQAFTASVKNKMGRFLTAAPASAYAPSPSLAPSASVATAPAAAPAAIAPRGRVSVEPIDLNVTAPASRSTGIPDPVIEMGGPSSAPISITSP